MEWLSKVRIRKKSISSLVSKFRSACFCCPSVLIHCSRQVKWTGKGPRGYSPALQKTDKPFCSSGFPFLFFFQPPNVGDDTIWWKSQLIFVILTSVVNRTITMIIKNDKYNSEFVGVPVVRVEMFRVTYI